MLINKLSYIITNNFTNIMYFVDNYIIFIIDNFIIILNLNDNYRIVV